MEVTSWVFAVSHCAVASVRAQAEHGDGRLWRIFFQFQNQTQGQFLIALVAVVVSVIVIRSLERMRC